MEPIFYINTYVQDHLSSKNNRPIHGRGAKKWLGKSSRLRIAEESLINALKEEWSGKPICDLLHICFTFHMTKFYTKRETVNKKMGDLVNLMQLPLDCLQKAGIIEDDCLVMSLDGSRRTYSEQNRLEISIYRYEY